MAHGVVSAGKMQLKRLTQDQADAVIAQAPKCDAPRSFDRGNLRILLLGRAFTGVYFSHATWPWDAAGQVECFRLEWKAKHHTAPWTRVLSDIAIKTGWHNADYNFFAALCAFNAAIGSKPYAVVTRSRIRAGMLGYSSGRLLFDKDGNLHDAGRALLSLRAEGITFPVTGNQARTLLDKIVTRGLGKRFQPYRGSLTYYAKFTEPEEIARLLIKKAERSVADPKLAEMGQRLRALKNGSLLCGGSPLCGEPSPHNEGAPHNEESATQAPPAPHPVTPQSPPEHHIMLLGNASLNVSSNASPNVSHNGGERDSFEAGKERAEKPNTTLFEAFKVEFKAPTQPEVEAFFESLKRGKGKRAGEWLEAFGQDERWATQDWRGPASRWVLERRHICEAAT
jgi:hypothetical protein